MEPKDLAEDIRIGSGMGLGLKEAGGHRDH